MVLTSFLDALPSSQLASLFVGLGEAKVEAATRRDGAPFQKVKLDLRSIVGDTGEAGGKLVLMEDHEDIQFRIPGLAQSKDPEALARCGHINFEVRVGRLYWDPSDGEIGVDWTILKDPGNEPSLAVLERTVASLLQLYIGEGLYHLAKTLSAPQFRGIGSALLETAKNRALQDMMPRVQAVLGS